MNDENRVYADFMPAGRPPTKKAPAFGQRLAALRKERDWTQPQLADQLGVSVKAITYYEREASNPTTKTLKQIAKVFGMSPAEFMNDQNAQSHKRKSGPPSRLQQLFDRLSQLPRNKQQVIADMLEGFLDKTA